jgi:hypothetical protein
MAARPDGKKGLYVCSDHTGGGAGDLDALLITATGAPNTYDLIDGDLAIVGNSTDGWTFHVFNASGTDATAAPDRVRPVDYATAGVWESKLLGMAGLLLGALSAAPASPTPGMIVLADRVNWDPLGIGSGGAYLVMYLGATSGWGGINAQLDEV